MKNNKNLIQWVLVLGLITAFSFSFMFREPKAGDSPLAAIKQIKIAGVYLNVEVASTPEARMQGLSFRSELKDGDSLLFVFDAPGNYPFWMKDMNFPIDIIWISDDMRVGYIKENAKPDSYPETFGSGQNAKYVLETVAGFSSKNNLKVGDKIKFVY